MEKVQSSPVDILTTGDNYEATGEPLSSALSNAIAQGLKPKLQAIDVNGEYPREFMQQVGMLGGFKQASVPEFGGTGRGIRYTIQVIEEIAKECLSTGFITWCQTVCGWYIQNSDNAYLKQHVLPRIIQGEILAGTGLSNPMKHFSGIERIFLNAERCAGGYILNGAIPWVSNVGTDHYFAIAAGIAMEEAYLMAIVPGNAPGLTLGNGGHFIALEGSSTHSCNFKKVFIPDEFVLAGPDQCKDFVLRIRPGFILSQVGFGLGLVSSCVELMKRSNEARGHVNCFLDDQVEHIEMDLHIARQNTYTLADEIGCGGQDLRQHFIKDVIQARIVAAELSLRASQGAMLHAGASGYRLHGITERKLRESYFVAIVTPALKHLKKLLHDLQAA